MGARHSGPHCVTHCINCGAMGKGHLANACDVPMGVMTGHYACRPACIVLLRMLPPVFVGCAGPGLVGHSVSSAQASSCLVNVKH
jgi:hypothetical protein